MKENPLFDWIQEVIKELFAAEDRRLQSSIDLLVSKHQEILSDSRTGFMFNGDYYRHSKTRIIERLPMLAWDLTDSMMLYLKDKKIVDLEKQQIRQILFKLLSEAKTEQGMRDVLPDCIVELFPTLRRINRSVSVETMIQHKPRLLREYQKLLPKLQFYSVNRLIY